MKKAILLCLIPILGIHSELYAQSKLNMRGVYTMLRQQQIEGSKDSLLKREQIKFYTGKYMLWAAPKPNDSLAEYGLGTYSVAGDTVVEYVFHTSIAGDRKDTFALAIIPKPDGYTQKIEFSFDPRRKFILSEDYKKVGTKQVSLLDGLWKMDRRLAIENGDTAVDEHIQYKVYQNGYFTWVNTYTDPVSSDTLSSFGYGTFTMNGRNRIRELNINSTFATELIGRTVDLEIRQPSKDRYIQTLTNSQGIKFIEYYTRMN